jgi:hypothetical protein
MQSTEETAKSFDVVKAIEIQRHDGNGDRVVIVGAVENLKVLSVSKSKPEIGIGIVCPQMRTPDRQNVSDNIGKQ